MVGVVVFLAVENPVAAAAIAAILLVSGIALVIFLWKRIRAGIEYLKRRRAEREPPAPGGQTPL
jgi:hypothetical protein